MTKILIAAFEGEEEIAFDELIEFLKKKDDVKLLNTFSFNRHLECRNITIDSSYRVVKVNGKSIELTHYEFEILHLLVKRPGQVFSKEQIYNQVWKNPYYGAENNVMSIIRRIRKKIEPNPAKPIYILTVWGVGYKFNNNSKRK